MKNINLTKTYTKPVDELNKQIKHYEREMERRPEGCKKYVEFEEKLNAAKKQKVELQHELDGKINEMRDNNRASANLISALDLLWFEKQLKKRFLIKELKGAKILYNAANGDGYQGRASGYQMNSDVATIKVLSNGDLSLQGVERGKSFATRVCLTEVNEEQAKERLFKEALSF